MKLPSALIACTLLALTWAPHVDAQDPVPFRDLEFTLEGPRKAKRGVMPTRVVPKRLRTDGIVVGLATGAGGAHVRIVGVKNFEGTLRVFYEAGERVRRSQRPLHLVELTGDLEVGELRWVRQSERTKRWSELHAAEKISADEYAWLLDAQAPWPAKQPEQLAGQAKTQSRGERLVSLLEAEQITPDEFIFLAGSKASPKLQRWNSMVTAGQLSPSEFALLASNEIVLAQVRTPLTQQAPELPVSGEPKTTGHMLVDMLDEGLIPLEEFEELTGAKPGSKVARWIGLRRAEKLTRSELVWLVRSEETLRATQRGIVRRLFE